MGKTVGTSQAPERSRGEASQIYLSAILGQAVQVLSLLDRESFSRTFGCFDRTYWAWKFTDVPGARFQEGVCFLSFLYATPLRDNPYHRNSKLLRWITAELHPADQGDTTTLAATPTAAEANLAAVDVAPTADAPAELVTDKGYFGRQVLKPLEDDPWKTRIVEPKGKGVSRWHGDDEARRAVYNNRARLLSGVAKAAFKLRAEIVERCFAHVLDRGGMRRTWLRGRDNVHERYLLHVAGHNLGLLMRLLIGAGTPKEAIARGKGLFLLAPLPDASTLLLVAIIDSNHAAHAAIIMAMRADR